MAFIKLFLVILLVLSGSQSFACDSTVLALLTGNDISTSTVSRFLSISNKLIVEGDMLNSYNITAARKQHTTIMNDWLELVSELSSTPMIANSHKTEFKETLSDVSKDLGIVRKLLEKEIYVNIHEIIEVCVTKITILGTLIKDNTAARDFLKFELSIYNPGVYLDRPDEFLIQSYLNDIELTINHFEKSYSSKANELSKAFSVAVENHRKTIDKIRTNQTSWEKALISYNNLKNAFVAIKQQLLAEGYIKSN